MSTRLLIVDDESDIRDMLSRHFMLQDYYVETAGNGVEALQVMETKRFDIVISDIRMPEMDGVDLLRHIRDEYPMARVIMITGYVTLENALACMRRGADDCVFKPLQDMAELDDAVSLSHERLVRWQEKLRSLQGMKSAAGEA
jgi:DNA-binding NtrC family response regulator